MVWCCVLLVVIRFFISVIIMCFFGVKEVTSVPPVLLSFRCRYVIRSVSVSRLDNNCWFPVSMLLESDVLSCMQL